MKKEVRTAVYDDGLRIEAYRFEGIVQPFPNHFHEHYVIGLIEDGERILSCKNRTCTAAKGSLLLFNPGDSHACVQKDGGRLDYRSLNITKEVMLDLAQEITSRRELPGFSQNMVPDEEAACRMRQLHEAVMNGSGETEKGRALLRLVSLLLQRYGQPLARCVPACREEIEKACAFMEQHCAEKLYLDQICRCAGLSRSALLRAFVRAKGVTPHRYLENIRISRAKKLLEQGVPPVLAALQTGFSDQSHFTNCWSRSIGLAPGMYQEIFPPAPHKKMF